MPGTPLSSDDRERRLLNQAIFERIYVGADGGIRHEYTEHFESLLGGEIGAAAYTRYRQSSPDPIDEAWEALSEDWAAELCANEQHPSAMEGVLGVSMTELVDVFGQLSHLSWQLSRVLDCASDQLLRDAEPPRQLARETRASCVGQTQHRLKPKEVSSLTRRYRDGESSRELARAFGVNAATVLEHVRRGGVASRPNVRKLTDEQVVEAGHLYEQGDSLTVLGSRFGVSHHTMRQELARAGWAIRERGRPALPSPRQSAGG